LRDSGKTIILISHKLEEIKSIADRCAVLRQGKLIEVLNTATTSTTEMANLMVGREVLFSIEKTPANFGKVVLKIENLCATNISKVQCVKDISFEVREGEIFAIAGVSGNGQTELADCIVGLMKTSSGNVLLDDEDISKISVKSRIEKGISYIPEDRQNVGLILDQSLAENIVLKNIGSQPYSKHGILNHKSIYSYADKIIAKYDVRTGQGARTNTRSMSGGNQQKAIIGREIELSNKLMIFVQPTRGLDVGAIEHVWQLILTERTKGKAILLISLELEEIMNLADTIGIIYNGHLEKIAPRDSLSEREVGSFMMGVKQNGQ
ncbi:MAG: ATP-binding cassette domain-containing protein, partial [Clostridia bacterium]